MNTLLHPLRAHLGHCETVARDIEHWGEPDDAALLACDLRTTLATCGKRDTRLLALAEAAAEEMHASARDPAETIGALTVLIADRMAERTGRTAEAAARCVP